MQYPGTHSGGKQYAPNQPDHGSHLKGAWRKEIEATTALMSGHSELRKWLRALGTPGVQAMLVHRFGSWRQVQAFPVRPLTKPLHAVLHFLVRTVWGIDIEPEARIGAGCYIGHFGGINVSGAARIGDRCFLSQQITIGVAGTGSKRGAPTIGNDVYVAPGARIFGAISVGDNCKIGANAVVYRDIPAGSTVVVDGGCSILER